MKEKIEIVEGQYLPEEISKVIIDEVFAVNTRSAETSLRQSLVEIRKTHGHRLSAQAAIGVVHGNTTVTEYNKPVITLLYQKALNIRKEREDKLAELAN